MLFVLLYMLMSAYMLVYRGTSLIGAVSHERGTPVDAMHIGVGGGACAWEAPLGRWFGARGTCTAVVRIFTCQCYFLVLLNPHPSADPEGGGAERERER